MPSRRTCSARSRPPAGSSTRSTGSRPTAGWPPQPRRRPGRRRGAPRDARGDAGRARRAAGAALVGRPARPRAARAACPGAGGRGPTARRVATTPVASGMIGAMRDVIVAANWKMNTTPADAGELARTIAAGRASRASSGSSARRSCASRPLARRWRSGPGCRASARRTSTTSSPARTPARSRPRCWRASRPGSSSATPSGGATQARPTR